MTEATNLGRITESRTDSAWGRPAAPVKNLGWFNGRAYTPAQLSLGPSTDREWYAYDATALILRGHCAYDPIAEALAEENLVPIKTSNGRAVASIWFNVLRDSVCGAYHEIVMSIDATPTGEDSALRFGAGASPFRYLYNNFGRSVCRRQFMHSLYINSPLSITWGREMQAFPKHPSPADTRLEDSKACFEAEITWETAPIVRAKVGKRWGIGPFVNQGLGLLASVGTLRLANFLGATAFDVPIQMPRKTAERYNVAATYLASVRTGLDPTAVRCWPWSAEDDFELGDVEKPTDCEANNAHALLKKAGFVPKIVTYVPFMQAYIGTDGS